MDLVFLWEASPEKGFKWMWVIWKAIPGNTKKGNSRRSQMRVKNRFLLPKPGSDPLGTSGLLGTLHTQSVVHGPAAAKALGAG